MNSAVNSGVLNDSDGAKESIIKQKCKTEALHLTFPKC